MSKKSLVEVAYNVLTKKYAEEGNKSVPMEFGELLTRVGEEVNITDEAELIKICSRFYTDLTLDGRFVIKQNNTWVLREHEKFDDVHIDMNEVYDLDSFHDEDEEEAKKPTDEEDADDEVETKVKDTEAEEELGEESEDDSYSSNEDEDQE